MIPVPKNWEQIIRPPSSEARERASSEFIEAQVALAAAPRRLLAGLRSIAAGPAPVRRRLDEMTGLLTRELRADACACFVARAGDLLELFAASGFVETVVRPRKIRIGEGAAGEVAAQGVPLVLSDVSMAPGETGFRSFCGVPLLRGGVVCGVLSIQSRLRRSYGAETVDLLKMAAMVLAELLTSSGAVAVREIGAVISSGGKPTQVEGISFGRGLAVGHAVLYEPPLTVQDIVADDAGEQKRRLRRALDGMHDAIDRLLDRDISLTGTETREILETYQMFARDKGWLSRIEAAIDKGLSAEAAVQAVLNETRVRMAAARDAYLRERLEDLEDLSNRLLGHLARQHQPEAAEAPAGDIILVARAMGPAALLDYDRSRLKGVVLEKGSHSNHVAIVARALGIPVVGQCQNMLTYTAPGDQMIVDGDHGVVYLRPSQYVIDLYARSMEARARRTSLYRRLQRQQPETADGVRVSVQMNAGLLSEAESLSGAGADGIGLFRTELSFMGFKKYPPVVKQAELYGRILDVADGKPVAFRTLDIGGDKPLPYFKGPEEDNPALGWRALRIGMDRPAVLRTQFRALILGARGRNLKVMLPLVTEVAEYDRARALLEMEKARSVRNGILLPEKIELGVMLEVPALLWQLDTLLPTVDFVSVGSNDLMQYLYAVDRGNNALRDRYDPLSPAMLSVLKAVADKCRAAGVPVSVCGEIAGQPLEAMVLIALGYQELSLPAHAVEAVKMMIPTLDTARLLPYLEQLMKSRDHSLRERLASFARDHRVNIAWNA